MLLLAGLSHLLMGPHTIIETPCVLSILRSVGQQAPFMDIFFLSYRIDHYCL